MVSLSRFSIFANLLYDICFPTLSQRSLYRSKMALWFFRFFSAMMSFEIIISTNSERYCGSLVKTYSGIPPSFIYSSNNLSKMWWSVFLMSFLLNKTNSSKSNG